MVSCEQAEPGKGKNCQRAKFVQTHPFSEWICKWATIFTLHFHACFFFLFLASLFRCFLSVMLKPIFRTVRPPPNTHTQAPSYHKSPFNWDKKGGDALKPTLSWKFHPALNSSRNQQSLWKSMWLRVRSRAMTDQISARDLKPRGWMYITMVWSDRSEADVKKETVMKENGVERDVCGRSY